MSREIKFRAWDKENECWLNFGYASIYRKEDGEPDTIFKFDFSDNYIVEQYTDLKDKNGKEIYEGDIVQFFTGTYERGIVGWDKDSLAFRVYGRFGLPTYSRLYTYQNKGGDCDDLVKVVGNIHENPELIGGEK